jgi:1,4-dihydroxy-2-naphthoate octaprenyltransferase
VAAPELVARVLAALVLVPVVLAAGYVGDWALAALLAVAAVAPVVLAITNGPWALLALAAAPLALDPVRFIYRREDGPGLIAALEATARLQLALGVLLTIGLARMNRQNTGGRPREVWRAA